MAKKPPVQLIPTRLKQRNADEDIESPISVHVAGPASGSSILGVQNIPSLRATPLADIRMVLGGDVFQIVKRQFPSHHVLDGDKGNSRCDVIRCLVRSVRDFLAKLTKRTGTMDLCQFPKDFTQCRWHQRPHLFESLPGDGVGLFYLERNSIQPCQNSSLFLKWWQRNLDR